MFRNILLPVDLTDRGERAVAALVDIAHARDAKVQLLHVIQKIQGAEPGELDDFYNGLRVRAQATLDGWAKELAAQGFEVESDIVVGKRALEILRAARDRGSDLVLLVSHAVEPESAGAALGTISHQVALLAPCTVMLLR